MTPPKPRIPCYTTNKLVRALCGQDVPPKGILTEMTGLVTFVHVFDVPLQLTCVPGVICALRIEYVVPLLAPLPSTV
jgi:hypothetical protein